MNELNCPVCRKQLKQKNQNDTINYECFNCLMIWYPDFELEKLTSSEIKIKNYLPKKDMNIKKSPYYCPVCSEKLNEVPFNLIFHFNFYECSNECGYLLNQKNVTAMKECVHEQKEYFLRNQNYQKDDLLKAQNESNCPMSQEMKEFINEFEDEYEYKEFEEIKFREIKNPVNRFFAMMGLPARINQNEKFSAWLTLLIVLINVIVYINVNLSHESLSLMKKYSFKPARFDHGFMLYAKTLFTSFFLHSNLGHLIFNLYFLILTGKMVESRMGHLIFVLSYCLIGFICNLIGLIFQVAPYHYHLGASGAISGCMGLFIVFFPKEKFFFYTMKVSSCIYLMFWFGTQIMGVMFKQGSGIGYSTHLTGFVMGVIIGLILKSLGDKQTH